MSDELVSDVYGETYRSAQRQSHLIQQEIEGMCGKGFNSHEEAAQWAKENHLDNVVLSRTQHKYFYVTHKGDLLTKQAFIECYGTDVLFVETQNSNGKVSRESWIPKGLKYFDNAKVNGEKEDRGRSPIYHRNFYVPTGYYDKQKGTYNIASSFTTFAEQTGRDTSHIYSYIKAIAGECSLHLLAWLRMKMLYPTQKTQVVPIIVSRAQGTGKTTFAEVICKGLFNNDNVIVTDQYDSQSRFNSDYADALIVCHEEKEYEDKKNSSAAIKSRATATTIRKENKGVDPIYQESYTDFIMTSNRDVPIKFDDMSDQRRFMIMEADETFTRKTSDLADEVFTKLYGKDALNNEVGIPFTEDHELIAQFKHELFTREDIKNTQLRNFPKTQAYNRCFSLPRTSEATEIESIMRSIAPFIKASLVEKHMRTSLTGVTGNTESITNYVGSESSLMLLPEYKEMPAMIALCRPMIFCDLQTNKPYAHATVERSLYDCDAWLQRDYGLRVYQDMSPLQGGFIGVNSRMRNAPAARIVLEEDFKKLTKNPLIESPSAIKPPEAHRLGRKMRVNNAWKPDNDGEFETVNEMKMSAKNLTNKTDNVQYMDTFLLESDEVSKEVYLIEQDRLESDVTPLQAKEVYAERLDIQLKEAKRLFNAGIVYRVVYSGAKSYHLLVRIKDAPKTLEEYKWVHAYLCAHLSKVVDYDTSCADPARLTRAAITRTRYTTYGKKNLVGEQTLVYESTSVFSFDWRPLYNAWLERPKENYEAHGRKLVPMKEEYKEAMVALLRATFFTDSKWDGRRQKCFFPAYRLCRMAGFTHDALWSSEGILEDLNGYYKPKEIAYWRTREKSDIIKQIDDDVEEQNGGSND